MSMTPAVHIRTSERRDYKRCPQRWFWAWRQGLKPKGEPSLALWFGIGWHEVMAHWYCGPGKKRGADPFGVWREYVEEEVRFVRTVPWEGAEYFEEKLIDAGKLGEAMLKNYFATFGTDNDIRMIAPEQTFQIMVPLFGADGKKTGELVEYDGTFDGVYRNKKNELWLLEHKTAKTIRLGHLGMDDQAGSYWAVATTTLLAQGLINKGEHLKGIMYNFARKGMPDDRPRNAQGLSLNQDGSVSKRQPSPFFKREPVYRTPAERNKQILRIGSEATAMNLHRNGVIPLYKNPTPDCEYGCSFFDLCTLDEQSNAGAAEFKRDMFDVKDPYADHRKTAQADE